MLEKILTTISRKSTQEIEKITQKKEEEFLVLSQNHQKLLEEKKDKEKLVFQEKTAKEIQESSQAESLKMQFALQDIKATMITEVYQKAIEKINSLSDQELRKLILKFASFVPENLAGEILAGHKTAFILQENNKGNWIVKAELNEEGFIFKSDKMELDLRISQVLEQQRETTDPKVSEILFN